MIDFGQLYQVGIMSVLRRCAAGGALALCLFASAAAKAGSSDWEIFVEYCVLPIENRLPFDIPFDDISMSENEIDEKLSKMSRSSIWILVSDGSNRNVTQDEFVQMVFERRLEMERTREYRVDSERKITVNGHSTGFARRSCTLDSNSSWLSDANALAWYSQWSEEPSGANLYQVTRDSLWLTSFEGRGRENNHVRIGLSLSTHSFESAYSAYEIGSAD